MHGVASCGTVVRDAEKLWVAVGAVPNGLLSICILSSRTDDVSINGVLEDLPLADVLQFVHLGQRTGTLYMWRRDDDQRAEIGFHDGKIVSAWTPGHQRLGDLLVDADLLTAGDLEQALETQRTSGGRSLGQILLERALVTHADIHRVIRDQVEGTIFDLVTWRHGEFHFEVDELHPVDEFSLAPGEVLDDLDLNTQMLLLEATRIFDERNRETGPVEQPAGDLDQRLERAGLSGRREGAPEHADALRRDGAARRRRGFERARGGEATDDAGPEAVRCQVVTEDPEVVGALRECLPDALIKVVAVRMREAGTRLPGESQSPIVVLDLRHHRGGEIASLARTRPTAPVIALVDGDADDVRERAAAARQAGATSVLEVGDPTLADCVRNLVRVFSHPQPQGTFGYAGRGGFSRFRRVVFDVQSGLLSATMALNLMHVISESVERAVLFLVQDEALRACGAFGFSQDGRPLAQLTSSLSLELPESGALREALASAKPQSVDFDAAGLPPALAALVGRPASGQVVLFPVLGAERPISLIYTDNGSEAREIEDIRILELATSQVGVAFENELLRQRLGGLGLGAFLEEALGATSS